MEEVLRLGVSRFEVSWEFLAASVCGRRQHTHGTGLGGVCQVLGGECVALSGDQLSRRFYWDAVQIASASPIADPHEATRLLRESVRDAVRAWASSYQGILLSLSGGLDSSIVFACLRDAPLKGALTCFHHYPEGPDADERVFARLVARSGERPLIERARDARLSLAALGQIHLSHQPGSYLYHLEHSHLDAHLAAQHQAGAVFTGWGGDQLFFQDHAIWAAADHLHRHGLRPQLWRVALDCARMDRISVWEVLRATFAQHARRDRRNICDAASARCHLIRPETLAYVGGSTGYLHPLMRDPRGLPSGKLWHVYQLLSGPWEYYDPLGGPADPESVAPLYSQPVLEACLRIPTDILTLGGWPRAIARHAFQEDLPAQIIKRQHKGAIEHHAYRVLRHNIAFVRELLLDGALVREGILDRAKLEGALSGNANRHQTGRAELFDYISIEAWLRVWGKSPPRSVAYSSYTA